MEALEEKKKAKLLKALAIARVTMFKLLSNKNRVEILYNLYESNRSWSELYGSLNMNPKVLRDHLKFLIRYEIVKKENKIYSLTDLGIGLCELNFFIRPKDIEEVMSQIKMQIN